MITIAAPAKINLTLELLGKRPDGFHEIRSVVQTIDLCDRLSFRAAKTIAIRSNAPGWVAEKSLVSRAAVILQEYSGGSSGASIRVDKHIPLVSGLGGDSSDAAAALRGLNHVWQSGLPQSKLSELGSRLGSDVAYFLKGGTALMEGRGETVTALAQLPRCWIVLVVPHLPALPDKTRLLYGSLNASHYTDGQITRRLAETLNEHNTFSPDIMYNVFEKVAFSVFPGLNIYRETMLKSGVPRVHLAGSGPTLFSLFEEASHAQEIHRRLKKPGYETYIAETFAPSSNGI